MHEYSIVQALLEQCEEHARANEATSVTRVELKIGVMSGVEPQLLATAFDTFKAQTVCDAAVLDIHIQQVVVSCKACGATSTLERMAYQCPACQSYELSVEDGEGMYLMRLEMV
ncbi:MAG: hydrogenase nickel incorporation protein HypA [Sulfuricurvum sp. PC08-66]|nr:MAG: hydrogenase nickel incorporation protein HypA [Sulfuricurvum sp. PC08-66]